MTAYWEMQLNDISKKKATYQNFMSDLTQKLPNLLISQNQQILQNLSKITPLTKSRNTMKKLTK